MKNLSELSDEQKSVMLARLCGWKYKKRGILGNSWWAEDDLIYDECYDQSEARLLDLYDTKNMSLAWRVLNWAMDSNLSAREKADIMALFYVDKPFALEMSPAEAQCAWLDKILSLAIEAGMLEVNHAND